MKRKLTKEKSDVIVAKYRMYKKMPFTEGYTNVFIHSSNRGIGGKLSPFHLRTKEAHIFENEWQFSKVYPHIYEQKIVRKNKKLGNKTIWEYPEEEHVDENGQISHLYWEWRKKGMANQYAIRYPNGRKHVRECVYSLIEDPSGDIKHDGETYTKLTYIESRKRLYCALYIELAPENPSFKLMQKMLDEGQKIQIIEIDGPNPKWEGSAYETVTEGSPGMDITEENIKFLLNDPKHPFGHGYVIATLLLGHEEWLK